MNNDLIERFVCHSWKQWDFLKSDKKITAAITGIQWGKTTIGAARHKAYMHSFTDKSDNFIVTAPTYKIMQQSTLPAFLKLMDGVCKYNKSDAVGEMINGGRTYFRTETDPDSIVGITNVRHIWADEAGKYGLYFWENIQARSSFRDCPISLTTSPYSMNWIYKELVRPVKLNKRDDVLLIQANSSENKYFPLEEYNRQKKLMDARRFNMMYGGSFEQIQGLVYDCFDENENQCVPFDLPVGTRYFGGIDWGFSEYFVLKVRAITPDGSHFSVSEFVKRGLTIMDMVAIAKQKKQIFGIQTFYCDPSQPGSIEEFNRHGLSAIGADNDIRRGIDLHYELIKTRKLKYFRGQNPYTLDELSTYHYAEPKDLGPDDDAEEIKPVGQNDHSLDADRYLTMSTYRTGEKRAPKSPDDTTPALTREKQIEQLKKKKTWGQTENWD